MFGIVDGTGFEVLDPRFNACFVGHMRVERLWTGGRWLEGPAWFAAGRYLVCSDIPNNRILRFDETDGSVSTFRQPANFSNGNTTDREGRLVNIIADVHDITKFREAEELKSTFISIISFIRGTHVARA